MKGVKGTISQEHIDPIVVQLKEIRRKLGWTQSRVGRALKRTPSGITLIENGKRQTDLQCLREWADLFDMEIVLRPKQSITEPRVEIHISNMVTEQVRIIPVPYNGHMRMRY